MVMPGDRSLSYTNPLIVQLFHRALAYQGALVVLIGVGVFGACLLHRIRRPAHQALEHRGATYLRWSFGVLWFIDGLLQLQPAMPLGLASQVIASSAHGSPRWLHAVVFSGVGLWNRHPLALGEAAAWIQMGIGFMFLGARGRALRVAALVSCVWALVVWVLGESLGAMFSSTSSVLFGWPGAAFFYLVAGAWLATSPAFFERHFAVWTLRAVAIMLALGALLQLIPTREFWHGGPDNALAAMTQLMSHTAQPSWLRSVVTHVGSTGSSLGGGVNLVVIFWLLISAVGLWRASSRPLHWPSRLTISGALIIWIVAQDAAVFGGLSTDLNSMIPLVALTWCAAAARQPLERTTEQRPVVARQVAGLAAAALGVAMLLVAVVPLGAALLSDSAETTLFLAKQQSNYALINTPAAPFSLRDQHGTLVSIPAHDGHYQLVTFFDPVCTTDCPLVAHQLLDLESRVGAQSSRLDIVVVAANPEHERVQDVRHFIGQNHLGALRNFHFVTGSLSDLRAVWGNYGVEVGFIGASPPSLIHSDVIYIIDPRGRERVFFPDSPAPGWSGEQSTTTALRDALYDAGLR